MEQIYIQKEFISTWVWETKRKGLFSFIPHPNMRISDRKSVSSTKLIELPFAPTVGRRSVAAFCILRYTREVITCESITNQNGQGFTTLPIFLNCFSKFVSLWQFLYGFFSSYTQRILKEIGSISFVRNNHVIAKFYTIMKFTYSDWRGGRRIAWSWSVFAQFRQGLF